MCCPSDTTLARVTASRPEPRVNERPFHTDKKRRETRVVPDHLRQLQTQTEKANERTNERTNERGNEYCKQMQHHEHNTNTNATPTQQTRTTRQQQQHD